MCIPRRRRRRLRDGITFGLDGRPTSGGRLLFSSGLRARVGEVGWRIEVYGLALGALLRSLERAIADGFLDLLVELPLDPKLSDHIAKELEWRLRPLCRGRPDIELVVLGILPGRLHRVERASDVETLAGA